MISIIVPVHEYNEQVKISLALALQSVDRQVGFKVDSVFIIHPSKIKQELTDWLITNKIEIPTTLIENIGNFDFQSQVNFGAKHVKTKYFSILEFDDEYSEIYFRNIDKYIKAYPDVSMYLPITIQVDKYGKALSLINDAAWSRDFVGDDGEQGFLNIQSVKRYTSFALTGSVFETESYLKIGGFKKNIKLTFGYEFLLRLLNSDLKALTIAKVGYKHVVDRDDSLFVQYVNTVNMKERKFWFDTANKEYYFTEDRQIDLSSISTTNQ